jgi:pimeloyl-ACP methyl ester carboxylesterase
MGRTRIGAKPCETHAIARAIGTSGARVGAVAPGAARATALVRNGLSEQRCPRHIAPTRGCVAPQCQLDALGHGVRIAVGRPREHGEALLERLQLERYGGSTHRRQLDDGGEIRQYASRFMKRWLRRLSLGLVALVALALMCGSAYEALARRDLERRFPLPGKLVDIGGRRLQIDCRGAGSPTVVFENGLGPSGVLGWSLVHDRVAAITRACTYSRAGILASESGSGVRDADAIADDLHALLVRAGERPPLILVGHSLGGIYAMNYTRKYGAEVAGLVFVDASHADMKQRMAAAGLHLKEPLGMLKVAHAISWTGIVRAMVGSEDPESSYMPSSLGAMLDELEVVDQSLAEAGALRQLGDRPLFVLTSGKVADEFLAQAELTPEQGREFQRVWRELQAEQLSWSTHGAHEIVEDAAHHIHEEKPDRVINATQWVIEAVRANAAH